MNVGELKELLDSVPDHLLVLTSVAEMDDGDFQTPTNGRVMDDMVLWLKTRGVAGPI